MQARFIAAIATAAAVTGAVTAALGQQADVRAVLSQLAAATPVRTALLPNIALRDENGAIIQGVRCATRTPSQMERTIVDSALRAYGRERGLAHREQELEIPVVLHVVTDRLGRFDVPEQRVMAQMDVLNDALGAHGYRFVLRELRRHVDNDFARKCLGGRAERRFKQLHAVDPAHTLNIYTCRPAQGVLGYAWLPSDFPESSFMHGVVVSHASLPGGGGAPFDEGDTLVHEVGHYLGLYHTFDGGCGDRGDLVNDTPAERTEAYGCPVGRDSCPAAGVDPIYNYMDYSDDSCMDEFTAGQEFRMDDQVAVFRPQLGS